MILAIVGSREYPNLAEVHDLVNSLPVHFTIISGGARGVDVEAALAARLRGMKVIEITPDYSNYPKDQKRKAPLDRNTKIIELADKVIAFWDGMSTGTLDVITKASKAGKLAQIFEPEGKL